MAIQVQGNAGTVLEVEAATRAMRTVAFPQDPLSLGYYALGVDNGTTVMTAGLAANSPIFSFRWGNANLALIRSVKMSMQTGAAAFAAASRADFAMFFARAFTVSDTGGVIATITGANCKKRTSFGTTLLTECRYSQTATLTAGTRTLDASPLARMSVQNVVVNTNCFTNAQLWQRDSSDEYPLILAQNEGLVIQATVPATGTWFYQVNVEWMEIASF